VQAPSRAPTVIFTVRTVLGLPGERNVEEAVAPFPREVPKGLGAMDDYVVGAVRPVPRLVRVRGGLQAGPLTA
jgi:hypothetical protein